MDQDDIAGADDGISLSLACAAEQRGRDTSDQRSREGASVNHFDTSNFAPRRRRCA
jgi:hypothetical protein